MGTLSPGSPGRSERHGSLGGDDFTLTPVLEDLTPINLSSF